MKNYANTLSNNQRSNYTKGISNQEAALRIDKYGPNKLPTPPVPSIFIFFLRQFLSPFIYILLIAAIISLTLKNNTSALFILIVLLLNAFIGCIQEYKAETSAASLRELVKGTAYVMREGLIRSVNIEQLVPGDLIFISAGDKVPADLKLTRAESLSIDESMLTGESMAVSKQAGQLNSNNTNTNAKERPQDLKASKHSHYCFAGTMVNHGTGEGVIQATGMNTELGKISQDLTSSQCHDPPLMIRIRRFTYQVTVSILTAILILLGIMLLRGSYSTADMSLMMIGLAVSTIPEGLPAALTVTLAVGMRRMLKHNVIIRRLVAVEALGSCTFICSDKTGTLTLNELTIRQIVLPDGSHFKVTGDGVSPGGEILGDDPYCQLPRLCKTGALANEAHIDNSSSNTWTPVGDSVDTAFLMLALKKNLSLSSLQQKERRLELIPYESKNALSASLNEDSNNHRTLYVKGSPEKIIRLSSHMHLKNSMAPIDVSRITEQFIALASSGYRVIALAQKTSPTGDAASALNDLCFLGIVGMKDPIRAEVYSAIEHCHSGGIEVALVTGDHPATAAAIADELSITERHGPKPVITGRDLRAVETKDKTSFDELIQASRIFARIEPHQKKQIVESFIRQGHFVAVTGDGVNDAPALRTAHAGIAMGKRGTDVAKETADIIITDDNFSSIVNGIEQGRIIYSNIRKVIGLLIATGFSALLLFLFTVLAGLPMPLTAIQLLWLNLVANGLQDVALAFEPKEGDELEHPPRNPKEPIFDRRIVEHIVVTGVIMGVLAFTVYASLIHASRSIEEARNLTLLLMVFFGNIHALSSRSETRSIFSIPLCSNLFLICTVPLAQILHITAMHLPGIRDILEISPITAAEWLTLLLISTLLLCAEELHKYRIRRKIHRD